MFPPAIYFMFMIFLSLTCYSKSIYENKLCLEKCLIETLHSCSTQILAAHQFADSSFYHQHTECL